MQAAAPSARPAPTAKICSVTPGRLRLRVQDARADVAGFTRLAAAVHGLPAVVRLEANPHTGALLVWHEGSKDAFVDEARTHGVLDVVEAPPPSPGSSELVPVRARRRPRRDGSLERLLSRAGALTLFGLAAYQARRGKLLPAGLPMIFQGWSFLTTHHPYGHDDSEDAVGEAAAPANA
jgi:hypothetical protein